MVKFYSRILFLKLYIYIYIPVFIRFLYSLMSLEERCFFAMDILIIHVLFVHKRGDKAINVRSITNQTDGTEPCLRRKCLLFLVKKFPAFL